MTSSCGVWPKISEEVLPFMDWRKNGIVRKAKFLNGIGPNNLFNRIGKRSAALYGPPHNSAFI